MPEFRALLSSDSEMSQRIRAFDWHRSSFGPPADWPQSLRSALSIALNSSFPTAIYWGADFRLLYNDAWSHILGPRHPEALGQPAREVWADIWHIIEPQLNAVASSGQGFFIQDAHLPMQRYGEIEETYWSYGFSPIAGEDGLVAGVFNSGQETTARVLAERRNNLLVTLADKLRALELPGEILSAAFETLAEHTKVSRLMFGEVYPKQKYFKVEAHWSAQDNALPERFSLDEMSKDIGLALQRGETVTVSDVETDTRLTEKRRNLHSDIGARAVMAVPVLRNKRLLAILVAHSSTTHIWSPSEQDLLESAAGRLWEELTRSRTEMALRENERRHRLIFEQARDIILTADLEQTIISCNPAAAHAIGLPSDEIIGHSIGEFLAPGEFERTSAMLRQKLGQGGTTNYEVTVVPAQGGARLWDVNSALTIDVDGKPIGLHAVARDITERRAFDEQQQLLINELNHRVKNTLALVQGLALQSFKPERSISEGQETFQARLGMLAAAHDLLTRQRWEGATISAIIKDAMAPYADPPGRISANGSHVLLTPKTAISLVLALHELGTNAAKYGALSVPEGKIAIAWNMTAKRDFEMTWRETGGPAVTPPDTKGFGLSMLQRAFANDLNGKVNISFEPKGLLCTIIGNIPEQP